MDFPVSLCLSWSQFESLTHKLLAIWPWASYTPLNISDFSSVKRQLLPTCVGRRNSDNGYRQWYLVLGKGSINGDVSSSTAQFLRPRIHKLGSIGQGWNIHFTFSFVLLVPLSENERTLVRFLKKWIQFFFSVCKCYPLCLAMNTLPLWIMKIL